MRYTQEKKEEVFNIIIDRISENGEALRNILAEKGMPSTQTFYIWLEENTYTDDEGNEVISEQSKQYARACDARADRIFDEMLIIADDGTKDMKTIFNKQGEPEQVEDREATSRSKLKIETRKWVLGKLKPKKYGERSSIELEGGLDNTIEISFKD